MVANNSGYGCASTIRRRHGLLVMLLFQLNHGYAIGVCNSEPPSCLIEGQRGRRFATKDYAGVLLARVQLRPRLNNFAGSNFNQFGVLEESHDIFSVHRHEGASHLLQRTRFSNSLPLRGDYIGQETAHLRQGSPPVVSDHDYDGIITLKAQRHGLQTIPRATPKWPDLSGQYRRIMQHVANSK